MPAEWQDVSDILVGPDDDDTPLLAVDLAKHKYIVAASRVGAERFLVVAKFETALIGEQQRRHSLDVQFGVVLLKDRADVDRRVDT